MFDQTGTLTTVAEFEAFYSRGSCTQFVSITARPPTKEELALEATRRAVAVMARDARKRSRVGRAPQRRPHQQPKLRPVR